MQEETKIYMVTSLDKKSTLEVSHEVFKLVCSLTAELNATKISLSNLVGRMVNPPVLLESERVEVQCKDAINYR